MTPYLATLHVPGGQLPLVTLHHQTQRGGPSRPVGERGNCYQAALASLLALPLHDVPHAFDGSFDRDAAWGVIDAWLATRSLRRRRYLWAEFCAAERLSEHSSLAVVVGHPPGHSHLHAVVGLLLSPGQWRWVHDPAPGGRGLHGTPRYLEVFLPLHESKPADVGLPCLDS